MLEAFWLILSTILSLTGMAWLALAMETHWTQVTHRPADEAARTRLMLRALGMLALPLSLFACLMADRPSMAVLVWAMLLSASSAAVAMLLARWPMRLRIFLLAALWR